MQKALIIVDVQNDFLPGGALPVPDGDAVIAVINSLQKEFPLVIASMDYHPPEHLSFAANHKDKKPGDVIALDGIQQILWPVHAVQKTPGASLAAELDITRIRHVIHKGGDPSIDSYSAFFDNGRKHDTGLSSLLKSLSVDEVYVCGLAGDYCALYTALDAVHEGFRTHFYVEATRAVNLQPNDFHDALQQMEQAGVTLH